jgi:hypothetical protein
MVTNCPRPGRCPSSDGVPDCAGTVTMRFAGRGPDPATRLPTRALSEGWAKPLLEASDRCQGRHARSVTPHRPPSRGASSWPTKHGICTARRRRGRRPSAGPREARPLPAPRPAQPGRPRRRCWSGTPPARPQPDQSHGKGHTTIGQRPATQNAGPAENQHMRPGSCVQPSPRARAWTRGPITGLTARVPARAPGTTLTQALQPPMTGHGKHWLTAFPAIRTRLGKAAAHHKPAAALQRQSSAGIRTPELTFLRGQPARKQPST